jgi:hypothetical protein
LSHSVTNFGATSVNFGTNTIRNLAENGWLFDGIDDNMEVSDAGTFLGIAGTNNAPFTVGMWVNLHALAGGNYYTLMMKGTAVNQWLAWQVSKSNLKQSLFMYNPSKSDYLFFISQNAMPTDVWIFMVVVYDGTKTAGSGKLWTNAVLQPMNDYSSASWNGWSNSDAVVSIGKDVIYGDYFSGSNDFSFCIATNLSASAITNLYLNTGGTNGPVGNIRARVPAGAYP